MAIFDYSVVLVAIVGVMTNAFDDDPAAGKTARQFKKQTEKSFSALVEMSVNHMAGDESISKMVIMRDGESIVEDFNEEAETRAIGNQSTLQLN